MRTVHHLFSLILLQWTFLRHHKIDRRNSGDWNIASFCSGCFNTINQKLKFFDKDTDITFEQWRRSEAYRILLRIKEFKVYWVYDFDMTYEEK